METVTDFIFLGSTITEDDDRSHEIRRRLLLGRTAMTNPDSVLKSRDIALPTKARLVKAMIFPVVICGCESWTIRLRIEEMMLSNCGSGEESWRVPCTAKRLNQSVLKKINPKYSFRGLMLKLKLQYSGHLT